MADPYVVTDNRESAEELCAKLTMKRNGKFALGMTGEAADNGKVVTGYITKQRTSTRKLTPGRIWFSERQVVDGWGIIERWRYADAPERGEFGGAFLSAKTVWILLNAEVIHAI